jgi:hypothetical protein
MAAPLRFGGMMMSAEILGDACMFSSQMKMAVAWPRLMILHAGRCCSAWPLVDGPASQARNAGDQKLLYLLMLALVYSSSKSRVRPVSNK